jgi:hypothetical protein
MSDAPVGFFKRLQLAWAVLWGAPVPEVKALPAAVSVAASAPVENAQDAALVLLAMLQREGRLIDFLQEEVTGFSDEQVGAAARVVHEGCRKLLRKYVPLSPVVAQGEGSPLTVPQGFDAQRFRLTGNVTGSAPYQGTLKHHGWQTSSPSLPPLPKGIDVRVLAPAEVELK